MEELAAVKIEAAPVEDKGPAKLTARDIKAMKPYVQAMNRGGKGSARGAHWAGGRARVGVCGVG